MRWLLGNVSVRVVEASSVERSLLIDLLSYVNKRYNPGERRYTSDNRSLYSIVGDEFPTGLAKFVYQQSVKHGFAIDVKDTRVKPCQPDPQADLEWLRHHPAVQEPIVHQIEAVEAAVRKGRGVVWVPTGGGKTEIAIGIARALPCRWMFLVHKADLLYQTAERFERRTGIKAGVVGDGRTAPEARFTVATFQTIHRRVEEGDKSCIEAAEGIIVDECHTVPANTFYQTLCHAKNAYYRFGLSGTPLARSDDKNLYVIGATGPVIYRVLPETLVKLGLLAQPTIRMVTVEQKNEKPTWRGVYSEAIVRSKKRNAAVLEVVKCAARPCLVFVQEVKHGQELAKAISNAGITCEFMWGKEATSHRQAAIQRLVRADTEVLVCSVIFQEGIDIPPLRSVVVASGGKSTIAALQRIGRGMRADAASGKTTFEVWDFNDRGCGCRPDTDDGTHFGCKVLEKQTRVRMRVYQNEGFDVLTVPVPTASG